MKLSSLRPVKGLKGFTVTFLCDVEFSSVAFWGVQARSGFCKTVIGAQGLTTRLMISENSDVIQKITPLNGQYSSVVETALLKRLKRIYF